MARKQQTETATPEAPASRVSTPQHPAVKPGRVSKARRPRPSEAAMAKVAAEVVTAAEATDTTPQPPTPTLPKGARPYSIAQEVLVGYIQAHPGCTKSEAARASSFGQGESTWRERMRTIAAFEERGLLVSSSREAARRGQAHAMKVTAKGARILAATEAARGAK